MTFGSRVPILVSTQRSIAGIRRHMRGSLRAVTLACRAERSLRECRRDLSGPASRASGRKVAGVSLWRLPSLLEVPTVHAAPRTRAVGAAGDRVAQACVQGIDS